MGLKLRGSNGKCACSNCYMAVEPSAAFCESCGSVFKGELDAMDCPSCETLISAEASVCPICNVRIKEGKKEEAEKNNRKLTSIDLNEGEQEFLSKLLTMKKNNEVMADTDEDIEEREQALKVLRTLATLESEENIEERIRELGEGGKGKEGYEKLRKELLTLGKPFETILERNLMNITLIDKEIAEKNDELKQLKIIKGENIEEKKDRLKLEIEDLQKKKQAMKSYESNIMMLGGAFRRLLGQQQSELFRLESDLKKRVNAFQKEVDMRRKQKEVLRRREEALDKREEELSHRFLDLKSRENEIKVREEKLRKRMDELKAKEEELKIWESEIESSRSLDVTIKSGENSNFNRDKWLKEQKMLQADLFKMKDEMGSIGNNPENLYKTNEELNEAENTLKTREEEIVNLKNQLKELSDVLSERDNEIEKLKTEKPEFVIDEETKKLLKILDDLLEKLPEEVVDKFARSDDYLLYERVLEKYKL